MPIPTAPGGREHIHKKRRPDASPCVFLPRSPDRYAARGQATRTVMAEPSWLQCRQSGETSAWRAVAVTAVQRRGGASLGLGRRAVFSPHLPDALPMALRRRIDGVKTAFRRQVFWVEGHPMAFRRR